MYVCKKKKQKRIRNHFADSSISNSKMFVLCLLDFDVYTIYWKQKQ